MTLLFIYLVICCVAIYFSIDFNPMGGEFNNRAALLPDEDITAASVREGFWVSFIPIINIYIIVAGISLKIPKIKKRILLKIKRIINEVEDE